MSRASCTPSPSSVNRRTPRSAISPIGASSSPQPAHGDGARPPARRTARTRRARAPRGPRRRCRSAARCWAWPRPRCSRRGPRPGSRSRTVSASSRPGWRRWVWRSTRPGATTQPPASSTTAPAGTSTTSPTARDAAALDQHVGHALAGGVDHPAAADRRTVRAQPRGPEPEQQEQDGHAHGHAVGHLAGDERAGQVGHVGGDLDAPVHRARVHDQGVVGQQLDPLPGEAVAGRVLPQRGQQGLALALGLHAQEVDDVDLGQHAVEVVAHLHRPAVEAGRQQGRRGDDGDVGARAWRRRARWTGPPGSASRRRRPRCAALPATPAAVTDRVAVEQGLGGVLVPAVAGVDDRRSRPTTPPARARRPTSGAPPWRRRPWPRSSGRCRAATRPSWPTTSTPRSSWCRPTGAWPPSRTTAGCGSTPRRTATPPSCPAAPAPWGWPARTPPRRSRSTRITSSMPSAPRSAIDRRCFNGRVGLLRSARDASRRRRRRRPGRRPSRRCGWAGSCPRSRAGWAAPGGPGRP